MRYYRTVVLVIALVTSSLMAALAQTSYTIADIAPNDVRSNALSINDKGQVVGNYWTETNGWPRPFLWSVEKGFQPLPYDTVPFRSDGGHVGAEANAINNNGRIAGTFYEAGSGWYLYGVGRWEADLSAQYMQPVGYLSRGVSIDGAGNVGGQQLDQWMGDWSGGVWNGKDYIVYAAGSVGCNVDALNDAGMAAGTWRNWGESQSHAFRKSPSTGKVDLLFDGYSRSYTYGINSTGDVVGSVAGDIYHMAYWPVGGQLQVLGPGTAYGINDGKTIVGNDGAGHACAWWTAREGIVDLNQRLMNGAGWMLTEARAINKKGQIVGTGTFNGADRAFVLTPTPETQLPGKDFTLSGTYSYDNSLFSVQGIVCDNLPGMDDSLKDYLTISSDFLKGATEITATLTNADLPSTRQNEEGTSTDSRGISNVGCLKTTDGKVAVDANGAITYYPPDEFNYEQEPSGVGQVTKESKRKVHLILHFKGKDGVKYVSGEVPILLARPPVVLVHGINNDPSVWNPLIKAITGMDASGNEGTAANQAVPIAEFPFVTVNHCDPHTFPEGLDSGNAAVEIAGMLLSEQIGGTILEVQSGVPVSDSDENESKLVLHPYPHWVEEVHQFSGYAHTPLEIRRVDIVAWSYGGVITRWYLNRNRPTDSSHWYVDPHRYVRNLYDHTVTYDGNSLPATRYGNDVRKVITLGSMWRGVPTLNFFNEAKYGTKFPSTSGVDFILAPHMRDLLNVVGTVVPIYVPSYEVMAINSPWMSQLIYHDPQYGDPTLRNRSIVPTPFDDNVAYGSVGGDNNAYLGIPGLPGLWDTHELANITQTPSWFPYLRLEYASGYQYKHNYSDGVVPLWSTILPGGYPSSLIVSSAHNNYASNTETQNYVALWLNNRLLTRGSDLNNKWAVPGNYFVTSSDRTKTWSFQATEMAPYPQSDLYYQVGGLGRIRPSALGDPPTIALRPQWQFSRDPVTQEIVATIIMDNNSSHDRIGSNVLVPDVQVLSVSAVVGAKIESNQTVVKLNTIDKWGKSLPFQVRFSKSLGAAGTKAVFKLQFTYSLSNGPAYATLQHNLP